MINIKTKKIISFFSLFLIFIFFPNIKPAHADNKCGWQDMYTTTITGYMVMKPSETINDCEDRKLITSGESKCTATKPTYTNKVGELHEATCCCDPSVSIAKPTTALFTIPDFQVQIPGLANHLATITCVTGEDCSIPWIGQYIAGIYNYALAIAGILAALMLMAGGLIWLISAGDASRITQAKELIIGSISGIIILLSSYVLLIQVNPNLVNLKAITVTSIKNIEIEPIANGSDSSGNTSGICPSDSYLLDIKGLVSTNASTPMLSAEGVAGLEKAIAKAKEMGVSLYVTSAFRSESNQQTLWEAAVVKYGDMASTYVARPGSCGGHRNGATIDVCIKGTKSCGHIGGATNANYIDADVGKLKQIMMSAGWVRYCAEWWHYQYNNSPSSPCSP